MFLFSYVALYSNNNYRYVFNESIKYYNNKTLKEFILAISYYNIDDKSKSRYITYIVELLISRSNKIIRLYYKLKYKKYLR